MKDYQGPDDLVGKDGLLKHLAKARVERVMGAELNQHLGYEKHQPGEKSNEKRRNGTSEKTVRSDQGPITLHLFRDREGTFELKIVGKHQRELTGFSDKILSMYARGMTKPRDQRASERDLRYPGLSAVHQGGYRFGDGKS